MGLCGFLLLYGFCRGLKKGSGVLRVCKGFYCFMVSRLGGLRVFRAI